MYAASGPGTANSFTAVFSLVLLQSQTLPQNGNNNLLRLVFICGQKWIQQAIKSTDSKRFILSSIGPGCYQKAYDWLGLVSVVWLLVGVFGTEVAARCAPHRSLQSACRGSDAPALAERAQLFCFGGSYGKRCSSGKHLWPYRHWWELQRGFWVASPGCSPKSLVTHVWCPVTPSAPCGCLPAVAWECLRVSPYQAAFQRGPSLFGWGEQGRKT